MSVKHATKSYGGRNIRMIDFAKGVVSKYGLEFELLPETDAYTSFVNRRIRLLR